MAEYEADVVVVGAGVAGLLAAWQLAGQGVRVLVLESGPRVKRAEAVANYRNAPARVPEAPYPDVPYAPRPTVLAIDDYYDQVGPAKFGSTYERRVGGTTWHWMGTSLRHLPADFELHSRYGVAVDWPISYDDLEPWYLAAEQALGVAGDSGNDLGSPRSGNYPMPPLPLTYLDKQIGLAVAPLGLKVHVTPQARNSIAFDGRPPCCGNGTCVPICPIGAKFDGSFLAAKAEQLGVQILESAVAFFVEADNTGRISAVRFKRPDGSEHTARGRVFIIAANAIETPKLLLISKSDATPNGVANSSDMVGRHLMDHPIQLSWALAEHPVYPYRSPGENAGIEDYRDGSFRAERSSFRMAIGEDGWSFPGVAAPAVAGYLIEEQGLRGEALAEAVGKHIARQFRFAILVEQMPLPENRVTPSDKLDAIGIPRPRIDYRLGEFVERGMEEARRVADRIFDAMGVSFREHGESFFGAGHLMGTYRMGVDPKTSVVAPDQRTHDHPNLFLLGAGVFPTVGTANPTLTLSALALRAVDEIRRTLEEAPA